MSDSESSKQQLDQIFMALADSSRRDLVHLLAQGERTVSELTAHFDMSMAAVSKHIKVLERARLIKRRVDGRTHYISLVPEKLTGALDWISIYRYFWESRLDRLNDLLKEDK